MIFKAFIHKYAVHFFVFFTIVVAYYFLGTRGTFVVPHDLDYFNPLARSFLNGRLDIPNPIVSFDLSTFKGKWYPYWGPIPALFFIPIQIMIGRYIPAMYLSIFFSGLSAVALWMILDKIGPLFLEQKMNLVNKLVYFTFFFFGTTLTYLGVRSGVWFVSQTVSFTFTAFAFLILLNKQLTGRNYFISSFLISSALLNRQIGILIFIFWLLRFADDLFCKRITFRNAIRTVFICMIPPLFFLCIFLIYNFVRFENPFDTGYSYQNFSYFDFKRAAPYGTFSMRYILKNLWLILFEIPRPHFNPLGNSVFFVSSVYLGALLTLRKIRENLGFLKNRITLYLWIQVVASLLPILPLYNLGMYQFGIRYALDFSLPLFVLSVVGFRGKVNLLILVLFFLSVSMHIYAALFW